VIDLDENKKTTAPSANNFKVISLTKIKMAFQKEKAFL